MCETADIFRRRIHLVCAFEQRDALILPPVLKVTHSQPAIDRVEHRSLFHYLFVELRSLYVVAFIEGFSGGFEIWDGCERNLLELLPDGALSLHIARSRLSANREGE